MLTVSSHRYPDRRIAAPVFVVGCCNSGTTILWEALKRHRAFDGPAGEGQDIRDLPTQMRHFLGRQTFRLFAHPKFQGSYVLRESDLNFSVASRIDAVYAEHCQAGRRLIEKSPANAIRTRFLQEVFPDASFVMIVRDGAAVSEGIARKRLFDPDRPHMAGLHTSLAEAAEQWLHANRQMLADRRFLARSLVVYYEDLVSNPEPVLANVFRFCGLAPLGLTPTGFETDRNMQQIARLSPVERKLVYGIVGLASWKRPPGTLAHQSRRGGNEGSADPADNR